MKKIFHVGITIFAVSLAITGCQGSPFQTGMGNGANPSAGGGFAPPAGMSGPSEPSSPEGGSGGEGGGSTGESAQDHSTVSDTPIVIVGAPMGSTPTETPCTLTGFTLCFSSITVEAIGLDGETGRPEYKITGGIDEKNTVTSALTTLGYSNLFILLRDLVFPSNTRALAAIPDSGGNFTATFLSAPGHNVELSASFCDRRTILPLVTPDLVSPLHLDPCSSTDPTDISTGSSPPTHPPWGGLGDEAPKVFDGGMRELR